MDNELQPSSTETQYIDEVPTQTSKNNLSLIIIFICIAILVVAVSVFVVTQIGKRPATLLPVANVSIPSNTDWKSFTSVGGTIKLNYPDFLTEGRNCHMEGTCFTSTDYEYGFISFDDGSGYTYPKAGTAVIVSTVPKTAEFSLDEYCEYASLWRNVASCTDDTVDGLPAKTQSWALENGQDYGSETIVITENHYFYLYQMYADPRDKEKLEGILETIELE